MTATSPDELSTNVRAQADFRLKFGIAVAVVMLAIMYYVSPEKITQRHVVELAMGVYIAYTLAVRYFSRRDNRHAQALVYITAVSDPLFLSLWLYIFGDPAILFAGMYVFTVLGFGFRLGNAAMFLCQAVSILGFSFVMLASAHWRTPGLAEISHLVVLTMVPLYASSLIRRLQSATALAQYESKAKSMLLAKVSHELRTPLTGIVSSAQLIEVETDDEAIANRAQAIHEMASGLDAEIERMLDLARLESKGTRSEAAAFELSHVTSHVMRVLSPAASIKGIELRLDADPRIVRPVMGSAQDLLGVLMNLVGNAIKFTSVGSVTIKVDLVADTPAGYRLQFGVKDTGIGIPAEHLSRIFEPFYQVESGANRKFGGTGLGTSIAMEYVKRMGGLLQVQSKPGEGTLFWFELQMPHAAKASEESMPRAAPRVVTGKRVLIADDNRVNLELLRQMLLKDQHQVTTATSGGQALQLLAREDFDLVLLDFNMGDIDGATVYQTYCFGRINTAPTYFITADATRSTAARLGETGAAGVIYKPLSFDSLRKAIASQFPEEIEEALPGEAPVARAAAPSLSTPPATRTGPRLRVVPVEFLDPEAIENLREIKDTPEFMFSMISEGLEDLESTQARLAASLRQHRLPDVHHDAHTMRGLSLSFGAVRLAAIADRLMTISDQVLADERNQYLAELNQTYAQSVNALRELRRQYAPSEAAGRDY
ncbi:ATP-binding protein [Arenimonas sp. MALMAid1274]|uniref:ATP-binding protein n=1 Tax=Arenimonas sp. MALMAid1274 TaxID=3411630 RepID=UPI003BA35C7B